MAGHMGNKVRTIQNLEIIRSDLENNLIFVKGSVPGSKNTVVLIQKNKKQINRATSLDKFKQVKTETKLSTSKDKKTSSKPEEKKKEVKKETQKKETKK